MIKDELLNNARKLHLDTHKEILDKIESEWHEIEKSLDVLRSFDVQNVKPMTRPIEQTITFMREDKPMPGAPKEIILKNAPQSDEDFILVNKVVNND